MNKKIFLAPTSIKSMAAAHAKIYSDKKEYVLRISDCHNTIKLWGKTDNEEDLIEGIEKLENLTTLAAELKQVLERKLKEIENQKEVEKKQDTFHKKTSIRLNIFVKMKLQKNIEFLDILAKKNKVTRTEVLVWIQYDNEEIVKIYNISLIAELLNIEPHEVWE